MVTRVQARCIRDYCAPMLLNVCVENIGSADSPSFVVSVNGMLDHGASTRLNQLASGEFRCLDFVYDFSIFRVREPFIHVDILSEVVESDERNNTLNFPQPSGTQCDIICPDYAPRPNPTPPPPQRQHRVTQ